MVVLEFLGDGKFTGTMRWNCLGTFTLMGVREPGPSLGRRAGSDPVSGWKEDGWSINDASYAAASAGMWGGSSFYDDDEEEREP